MDRSPERIGEDEWFENGYRVFRQTIEALAKSAPATSADYGGYNVAGELVLDVRAGAYLCDSPASSLSQTQKDAICALIQAVDSLPDDAVLFTDVASESVARLQHPAWVPVRKMAADLLTLLDSDANDA